MSAAAPSRPSTSAAESPGDVTVPLPAASRPASRHVSPHRWLLSQLAPYRGRLLLCLLTTLAWELLSSLASGLTGRAFDAVSRPPPDTAGFRLAVLILLAVILLRGLCGAASVALLTVAANSTERDFRDQLYRGLLGKSQTFFDRQRIGDLTARATNDAAQVNLMIQPGIEFCLLAVLGTLVPLAFIAVINPQLLLVPLLLSVAFTAAVRRHDRRLTPLSDRLNERFAALTTYLSETLSGIELVQSAGRRDGELDRFTAHADAYRDAYLRRARWQALYLPPILLSIALAGALIHGLLLVAAGRLTAGQLIAYLGLVALLSRAIGAFGLALSLVRAGLSGAARILDLLEDETALPAPGSPHSAPIAGGITFEHVTFTYAGEPTLADVSFHVEPGQTVALVGAAGAGKSTLVKLLNRTYDPDAGRILIDGIDLRCWDLDTVRAQLAVIEQDVVLFSRSIAANIAFGLDRPVSTPEIEQAARTAQAHAFITHFPAGYQTAIGERGRNLSGGQRQRLAIARTLLTAPRILVMDDATSAVDSATDAAIHRAIEETAAGRTTILITHRLAAIKQADLILVLDRGRVVEQGCHDDLIARCPLYAHIFAANA